MRPALSGALAGLALLLLAAPASAIPRFAMREGVKCATCHVDPNGGGMRNDYGRGVYGPTVLPMDFAFLALPFDASPASSRLSDNVALGADFRLLYQHLRKDDGSMPPVGSFFLMEAAGYAAADFTKYVTLYLAPMLYGSTSVLFEAAAILHTEDSWLYVKAGRFTPVYGLKLPNHSTFIRKHLGFNVLDKETGLEAGFHPGPLSFQLSVFNGIPERVDSDWDDNLALGVSGRTSAQLRTRPLKAELGFSGYYNVGGNEETVDPTGTDTRIEDLRLGVFGGFSVGRLTYLAEIDLQRVDDRTQPSIDGNIIDGVEFTGTFGQLVSYQELSFVPIRGLELIGTHEFLDDDLVSVGNAAHRVGGGLELFVVPNTELKLHYRYVIADPRHRLAQLHEALALIHLFF